MLKQAEELINFQAYHDLLTHLPNQALLRDRLSLAVSHAEGKDHQVALMVLDLDQFKRINVTLDRSGGDRVLIAITNRLASCLRKGESVSRSGDDEFMFLLPEVYTREEVALMR